jgi:hypothetical protein
MALAKRGEFRVKVNPGALDRCLISSKHHKVIVAIAEHTDSNRVRRARFASSLWLASGGGHAEAVTAPLLGHTVGDYSATPDNASTL